MASAVSSSAVVPAFSLAASHNLKLNELFPKEILDAVGGVEVLEKLGKSPRSPEYSANVDNEHWVWKDDGTRIRKIEMPDAPTLMWGLDRQGRPFIEVLIPGDAPVVFYTYSNCSISKDFTDLSKWQCAYDGGSTALWHRPEKVLVFLSKIGHDPDIRFSRSLFWD
jgi:hypothetical protein